MKNCFTLIVSCAFLAIAGCNRTSSSTLVKVAPEKVTVEIQKKYETFRGARGAVVSSNGRTVAVADPESKMVVVRDLQTGTEKKIDLGTAFPKMILSPNGLWLAARTETLHDSNVFVVWNLEKGEEIHRVDSKSLQFKFSHNSKLVAYVEPESKMISVVTLDSASVSTIRNEKAIWEFSFHHGYDRVLELNTGTAWEIIPGSLCGTLDDVYGADGAIRVHNWNPAPVGHPINREIELNLSKRKK